MVTVCLDLRLGDFHRDLLCRAGPPSCTQPGDLAARTLGQLHEVILDEGFGDLYQHHIAGEPSVVPPVGIYRRDGVAAAGVVDLRDHEVVAFANLVGDFEVEGRESAFMFAQGLPVEIDASEVVGGPEIDEDASVFPLVVGKRLLVPDRTFVKEQFLLLRVPVAGNIQDIRFIEIVFDELMLVFGLGVQVEAGVEAGFVRIDDGLPCAIQADGGAVGNVVDQRGRIRGGVARSASSKDDSSMQDRISRASS